MERKKISFGIVQIFLWVIGPYLWCSRIIIVVFKLKQLYSLATWRRLQGKHYDLMDLPVQIEPSYHLLSLFQSWVMIYYLATVLYLPYGWCINRTYYCFNCLVLYLQDHSVETLAVHSLVAGKERSSQMEFEECVKMASFCSVDHIY